MKSKKIIILTIIIAILGIGGYLIYSQGSSSNKVLATSVSGLQIKDFTTSLDISGVLIPNEVVNINPKLGGKIKTINVEVGSKVKAGDILATIEAKELSAQVAQAQAGVNLAEQQVGQAKINMEAARDVANSTEKMLKDQEEQAKINFDTATRTYNRDIELVKVGGVSQSQLEDDKSRYEIAKKQYEMASVTDGSSAQSQIIAAKSKFDLAKKQYEVAGGASLDQARANLAALKVQLENATILSPISGIVTNKNLNVGELASTATPIVNIVDTSALKLKGTVSQEFVPLLTEGQDIEVTLDSYKGKTFAGKISKLGPVAVSTGIYFPIEISVENKENLLAGFSAHAKVRVTAHDKTILPITAIIENNGKTYVYVINEKVAQKRIVSVGLKNENEVEIVNGINENEKVATTNVRNLFDGAKVEVK